MSHTMLYKPREGAPNPGIWNLPADHLVVADDQIEAHRAKGWKTAAELHAHFHDPKPAPKTAPKGKL